MDDDIDAQTISLLEPMHLGGGGVFGMPGLPPDMSVKIGNVGRWPRVAGTRLNSAFHMASSERRDRPIAMMLLLKPLGGMYIVRASLQRGSNGMRRRRCPWCQAKIAGSPSDSFSLALFSPLSFSPPLLFLFLSLVIIAPPARNLSLIRHRVCAGGSFINNNDVSIR